jgi:hypothetical protein
MPYNAIDVTDCVLEKIMLNNIPTKDDGPIWPTFVPLRSSRDETHYACKHRSAELDKLGSGYETGSSYSSTSSSIPRAKFLALPEGAMMP